ncbi:molybdate ABC transporter substrate-binding protein [Paenibacillus sp. GCM10027626]|uniref:molybdate ABC transporter substrate-binding protein n=1 Tax=Paenibacillus sp. GCM10027626 TaxID=3273411 RepID=UPI00362FDE66
MFKRFGRPLFFLLVMIIAVALIGNEIIKEIRAANQSASDKTDLLVSAAVSLSDSLEEIKTVFEKKQPKVKIHFNFGASGALRQQIEQGAAVDLFLSADEKNMKLLVDQDLIDINRQSALLGNELVVVVPAESTNRIEHIQDLLRDSFKHVALGEPRIVPAGTYAEEALRFSQQWDALKDKAVFGNNVRQVLAYVETGNADAGFVYKTDALSSDKVKMAYIVDQAAYSPILYYVGTAKDTKHTKQAQAFYEFLLDTEAQSIFQKYGFRPAG